MTMPMSAPEVFDREYLEIRAKILELAASFDRLDRGEGSVGDDARMGLVQKGLEILQRSEADRAEAVQLLFSREYSENWRSELDVPAPNVG